jgi:hypothetical protein
MAIAIALACRKRWEEKLVEGIKKLIEIVEIN